MSDMKCPVCGEKIEHIRDGWCNCNNRCIGSGSLSLWQALIDSMKEHDLCHDALVERTKELDRSKSDGVKINIWNKILSARCL